MPTNNPAAPAATTSSLSHEMRRNVDLAIFGLAGTVVLVPMPTFGFAMTADQARLVVAHVGRPDNLEIGGRYAVLADEELDAVVRGLTDEGLRVAIVPRHT